MYDPSKPRSSHQHLHHRRRHEPPLPPSSRRRSWCCSFTVPPLSPENATAVFSSKNSSSVKKTEMPFKSPGNNPHSFPNSPSNPKPGLVTRIDPRRILSPGRVSPIDETVMQTPDPVSQLPREARTAEIPRAPSPEDVEEANGEKEEQGSSGMFDARLNLKGRNGSRVVLELSAEVLSSNSSVFADLIADYRRDSSGLCRIEVPDVENLNVFRETIELMFEDDIVKRLMKMGVYRTIDVLEVSAGIKFSRGVSCCLKYLEAVPWAEEEEEKLRILFDRFKFDDAISKDIMIRLYSSESADGQQNLVKQLVWSITASNDLTARNELKSLVKGLLSKSSVYDKDYPDLNQEDLFAVCESCLNLLASLFEEAITPERSEMKNDKPLIERISKQVDNINWLLDILLDHQIAEDFVDLWASQEELLRMHEKASPMIRYEISRVSAALFIALGSRKMHSKSQSRLRLLQAWFRPMLLDFGWLNRCRKGLEMKEMEEALGQVLLTLPLKEQYALFMEWFRCFSKHGTECPNLSKAFQIWWRRSFLKGLENSAPESR